MQWNEPVSLARSAARFAKDPVYLAYLLRAKMDPAALWRRQSELCRCAGLKRPVFIFSFDCDTTMDIRVVGDVHAKLADCGITPVYAVPGELLERGAEAYRKIAESGASFINHGYAEHTRLDEARKIYESTLFYDRQGYDWVRADIEAGHRVLQEVLGVTPVGFRTPHFGTFQKSEDLSFLHGLLMQHGYRYSTSTVPFVACRRGPHKVADLWEFPVTGCYSEPLRMLDSWGFRFAPGRTVGPADYVREIGLLRQRMAEGEPCFVNLYADPSQVHDWPEFFTAVAGLREWAVPSYDQLIEMIES